MLELAILPMVCKKNGYKAVARGKSKAFAYVYTVLLWFIFELLGGFVTGCIAVAVNSLSGESYTLVYMCAFLSANLGGWLAGRIASRGDPLPGIVGNLTLQEAEYLRLQGYMSTPCHIVVHVAMSFNYIKTAYLIQLNGQEVGQAKVGETIQFTTDARRNVVSCDFSYGIRLKGSVIFDGLPGGLYEIFIKGNSFQTARTKVYPDASMFDFSVRRWDGSIISETREPSQYLTGSPTLSFTPDPGSSSYCRHCGALLDAPGEICSNCSASD